MDSKQFVEKIQAENQALFKASQINVKAYFDQTVDQTKLVDHFIGRMVNERMNMVEISNAIANMPANTDPEELQLLTKQAHDEAVHFRLVKEVIERIQGFPVDVNSAIAGEAAKPTAKGAGLLAKYGAESDPIALAAYQLVAEGRAEAVWNQMADCIEDQFIATRYARIAKDEGFHSQIGARKLEQLVQDDAARAHADKLISAMRRDLFEISCQNTAEVAEARALVTAAYGW